MQLRPYIVLLCRTVRHLIFCGGYCVIAFYSLIVSVLKVWFKSMIKYGITVRGPLYAGLPHKGDCAPKQGARTPDLHPRGQCPAVVKLSLPNACTASIVAPSHPQCITYKINYIILTAAFDWTFCVSYSLCTYILPCASSLFIDIWEVV
jgi:hypothetical protein